MDDTRPRSISIFIIPSIILLFLLVISVNCHGKTIFVDDDEDMDFSTIQDAIDASQDRDVIRVFSGFYPENITVDKSIRIIGNGSESTTISPSQNEHIVVISANEVEVSGFTITDAGSNMQGIRILTDNVRISNNTITKANTNANLDA